MTVRKEGTQFLRWVGPLLDALRALGGSATPEEATDKVAELCDVPESKQNELMESGQPRFRNQVAWARFYLKREGLLDSSTRGVWRLTEKGQATQPTYAQAQEIFRKQVKIDAAARKQRQNARPTESAPDTPDEVDLSIAANYRDRLLAAIQALAGPTMSAAGTSVAGTTSSGLGCTTMTARSSGGASAQSCEAGG